MSRARLAQMIADSRNLVAFIGAGMSTESGIPDFRSSGGVWSRMKPIDFQAFVASEEGRREAWNRVFTGAAVWTGGRPNALHQAVSRSVAEGRCTAVITQNVDNMHQESGVPEDQVIELHGNASYATGLVCGERHELADLRRPVLAEGVIPACRACGGLVKSATIAFRQSMPEGPMRRAEDETSACDLFLVL